MLARLFLICVVIGAGCWFGGALAASLGTAPPAQATTTQLAPSPAPAPPAPGPPPGWTRTDLPYTGDGEGYSWCEGKTRVHTVSTGGSNGGAALALEPNAATCGGSNP